MVSLIFSSISHLLTSIDSYLSKELEKLQIEVILPGEAAKLAALHITSSIVDKIKEG